jgi:hypothetical protein
MRVRFQADADLNRSTAKLTLHRCRQDGGDPWCRIAAILAAVMQSEFCGTALNQIIVTATLRRVMDIDFHI